MFNDVESTGQSLFGRKSGISLVETLVSMSLVGVILIPMLFLSSAFFLAQLTKGRQNVDVSHSASLFSDNLMEELYLTQRILPDSNSTEIHFGYYDQVQQASALRGYRIVVSGSNATLEKLYWDTTSGQWLTMSPYGVVPANQVLLPSTATFKYCIDPTCDNVAPQKAVYVHLTGWTFSPVANPSRVIDFPDLDFYVGAGSAGGPMLANNPQEIYSFPKSSSFGSTADLNLVHLNTSNKLFNYTQLVPSGGGALSTIVSAENAPGYRGAIAISPLDGRMFFGGDGSNFWTWKSDTGLSTIGTGFSSPGAFTSVRVSPVDGRTYFGSNNNMFTWSTTTGLSTLLVGSYLYPGFDDGMAVSSVDGRVFFGEEASPGGFWSWQIATGLSTIYVNGVNPAGYDGVQAGPDGRVYWGDDNSFWSWKAGAGAGTGLSTIITGSGGHPGHNHEMIVSPVDGRVLFAEDASAPANVWSWLSSTGLSTIITGDPNVDYPGQKKGLTVSPLDGRFFFGTSDNPGSFFTWQAGSGAGTGLSTIVQGNSPAVNGAVDISPLDGRVFFGDVNRTMWTWKSDTGLSTIPSTLADGYARNLKVSPYNGRVFFSDDTAGTPMYTWSIATGLSTIISSMTHPSYNDNIDDNIVVSPLDGRAFFGDDNNPGNFWTWKSSTGLSTLLGKEELGLWGQAKVSPIDGRVYFMEDNASGGAWTWRSSALVGSVPRATVSGAPTNQPLTVTLQNNAYPNYTASAQDVSGDLYLSDSVGKTLDRYFYSSGGSMFFYNSQFNWSTNTGSVGAVVPFDDNSNSGVALLDTTNSQIDIYNNRKATGTVGESSHINLSGNPTGLAISGRTGNWLLLDSTILGTGVNKYVRLYVMNNSGTALSGSPYKIYLGTAPTDTGAVGLDTDASAETNFKIQYDATKNVLYLIAPNVGRVYALTLPDYF